MSKPNEFVYRIGDSLYLNVTNRCTSSCTFCIRENGDGVDGHYLWLTHEPTIQEMEEAIAEAERDNGLERFDEYVFCGYGEPLLGFQVVVGVARYLKARGCSVRINTNGHGCLANGRNIVPELAGLVDVISISLNAESPTKYQQMCRTKYGPDAFGAMVYFTEQCRLYIPRVILTVVDVPGIDVAACGRLAEDLGVEFRVRSYIAEA